MTWDYPGRQKSQKRTSEGDKLEKKQSICKGAWGNGVAAAERVIRATLRRCSSWRVLI